MSDKGKQSGKSNADTAPQGEGPLTGELVKRDGNGETTVASLVTNAPGVGFLRDLGVAPGELAGFQQTASGQVTKWFDIRPMIEDPSVSDKLPTKAKDKVG